MNSAMKSALPSVGQVAGPDGNPKRGFGARPRFSGGGRHQRGHIFEAGPQTGCQRRIVLHFGAERFHRHETGITCRLKRAKLSNVADTVADKDQPPVRFGQIFGRKIGAEDARHVRQADALWKKPGVTAAEILECVVTQFIHIPSDGVGNGRHSHILSFHCRPLHPKGFDMPVGERGQALSGGQRQSVALARLLINDPQVIFLDEPSSAMDLASERLLIEQLKRSLRPDQTIIVSTHRYSMLDLVDRLIVLSNSKIAADGPKEQVLEVLKKQSSAPRA